MDVGSCQEIKRKVKVALNEAGVKGIVWDPEKEGGESCPGSQVASQLAGGWSWTSALGISTSFIHRGL